MTSGASVAALLALQPAWAAFSGRPLVLLSRSVGIGESYIPNRLQRGEAADVVIVADDVLRHCMAQGWVLPDSRVPLHQSLIGMAVREGAAKPKISTVDLFQQVLLAAKSVGYSASASGDYLAGELWPRLGIADRVMPKAKRIGHERIAAVVARGEVEIGFEQISELLPVPGIAHVTPLPPGAQRATLFSGGVATASSDPVAARALLQWLRSPPARQAFSDSGLEPLEAWRRDYIRA